jgi:serine/threonine protein kinase
MSLGPGARLGPYEILSAIGARGMGEVYRARDTKLGRDVALKVLPDTFALDSDRLARFKREAQVLASLNHPHIAAIYGFEDSGETQALVRITSIRTMPITTLRPTGVSWPSRLTPPQRTKSKIVVNWTEELRRASGR